MFPASRLLHWVCLASRFLFLNLLTMLRIGCQLTGFRFGCLTLALLGSKKVKGGAEKQFLPFYFSLLPCDERFSAHRGSDVDPLASIEHFVKSISCPHFLQV